jgi:hypothetical protein
MYNKKYDLRFNLKLYIFIYMQINFEEQIANYYFLYRLNLTLLAF